MKYTILILVTAIFMFTACQSATSESISTQNGIEQVSVQETNQALSKGNVQFIDVRTVEEYSDKHAPKSINMPIDSLEKDLAKLDKENPVYLICQSGSRSQKGAEILKKAEFKQVYNVKGGTVAWVAAGLPTEK